MSNPSEQGTSPTGRRRRRTSVERRRARARGLDRHGRPLPRALAKRFNPHHLRCFICRREYGRRAGNLQLLGIGSAEGAYWTPYAYRCFDRGACLERERHLRSINQLPT